MSDKRQKGEIPEVLREHIPYRIGMLTNLIRQATTDHYIRQSDISAREWRVLAMIGIAGPIQASDIVLLTGMDKATITRAVNRLTKMDLVNQTPSTEDRRAKDLSLSDKGEAFCDEIIPQMLGGGEKMADALSREETRVFLTCLDKLSARASRLLNDISD